jgi:hypothetical protein
MVDECRALDGVSLTPGLSPIRGVAGKAVLGIDLLAGLIVALSADIASYHSPLCAVAVLSGIAWVTGRALA